MKQKIKRIRLKLAAWIAGGSISTFEGRSKHGEWWAGYIITTKEADVAFRASFRKDALVYKDTALTDRDPEVISNSQP